ncbi:MAG: DUF418 domain-containing protein [Gammaproteobacteria bacterium]|nr:DUF418 domain-containing protein [Gammaproteobacteria bacterium]
MTSSTDQQTGLAPVSASERIQTIDVLRGFALLGILLVNMHFFYKPIMEAFNVDADALSPLGYGVEWFIGFFAQGKFYPLFSFLFGLGFAVQLTRAEARGGPFKRTYALRIFILLVIGVLHGTLIWAGDILTMYAIMGFVMLLLFMFKRLLELPFKRKDGTRRRIPFWIVLLFAALFFALPLQMFSFWVGSVQEAQALQEAGAELTPQQQEFIKQIEQQQQYTSPEAQEQARYAYGEGSWLEATKQRSQDFALMLSGLPLAGWFVLCMFLIGAVFGRLNLIGRASEFKGLFVTLLVLGVAVGMPLSWQYTGLYFETNLMKPGPEMLKANQLNMFAGLFMSLMFVAAITLLMQTGASKWLGKLAPMGRMALTNYLLQSFISTFVFYGYGLGFFGQIGPVTAFIYAIVFWSLQIPLSIWWMNRYAFGPVEWLWRTLTYMKRQPMKLANRDPVTIA